MYIPDRFQFEAHAGLRAQNKKLVEHWFTLNPAVPEDTRKMNELFDEFGRKELRYQLDGTHEYISEKLREHHDTLPSTYTEWEWKGLKVTGTQFPNVFWAFSTGSGVIRVPEEIALTNKFLHLFVFEGGKIRLLREWSDPARALAARGVEVPYV